MVKCTYTTVKLKVEAKKKLEELQARLRLRGIKASLHDILEKLIEFGLEEEETLVSKFISKKEQIDPMLELLEKPLDWGVKDSSIRIDESLYGDDIGDIHRYRYIRSSKE